MIPGPGDGLRQPWVSIAESLVPRADACANYDSARRSPCESCPTSPCCSYLPLTSFRVSTLSDLDYAAYLLNFERIELGLSSAGDWSVFYRYPCRFLDRRTFACTIHNSPEQPHICRNYNPYQCWYKTALTRSSTAEYVRLDRTRLRYLMTGIGFDTRGQILESPDWQALLEGIDNLFDGSEAPAEPEPVQACAPTTTTDGSFSFRQLQNPCNGCAAYCCRVLQFPIARPAEISALDYLTFCAGFPGIRIGISDAHWLILVETRCRHLEQNRCSVFGQSERPLVCRYFDEWRCSYKALYERPQSSGWMHIGLEEYRRVLDCVEFDASGTVLRLPAVAELRAAVQAEESLADAGGLKAATI